MVDVYVEHKGKSMGGLTAKDFELYDNGVLQEVELVQTESIPLSVIMLFDTSESVQGEKLERLRAAASSVIKELEQKDQASLIAFSIDLELECELTTDKRELQTALTRLQPRGGTALKNAVYGSLKVAEGLDRPVILLFTDGTDTFSWLSENEVLDAAKESNATIYALTTIRADDTQQARTLDSIARYTGPKGKTSSATRIQGVTFLESITAMSGGLFLRVESVKELERSFLYVLGEMKSRYLLTYYPRDVNEKGWHKLEVKLKNRKGKVRARRGYFLPHPVASGQ